MRSRVAWVGIAATLFEANTAVGGAGEPDLIGQLVIQPMIEINRPGHPLRRQPALLMITFRAFCSAASANVSYAPRNWSKVKR